MSKYLTPEHPSHSCDQAWFLFAVTSPRHPGFGRLLLVEAKNHAAVSFLERISADGGRVSQTCVLMTVHRQCQTIGIRSDLAEEVLFSDFANHMVDRKLVERDELAVKAYREAVAGAAAGLSVPSPSLPAPPRVQKASSLSTVRKAPDRGPLYQDALAALTSPDLGFKKARAEAALDSLGDLNGMSLSEVVAAGLRACKSPAA
jgi:hypothetical protein